MNKPGVMIYFNMIPSSRLPDADRLRLYDAMMEYGRSGTEPEFEGALGVAWDYVAPVLALDDDRYQETRAKRSRAGKLSGIARREKSKEADGTEEADVQTQTNSVQSNSVQSSSDQLRESITPAPRKKFTPPSEAEVTAYVRETGLAMDPQGFVDYYTSNGWRVGSHTMKDWRAAARNWARKEKQLPQQVPKPAPIVLAPLEDPYGAITY